MTEAELRSHTRKELVEMAKQRRIAGWSPMRKDELIKALIAAGGRKKRRAANGRRPKSTQGRARVRNGSKAAPPKRTNGSTRVRNLSTESAAAGKDGQLNDQLAATLCESDWIRVHWQLSRALIDRAAAVLKLDWHGARPLLRMYCVTTDEMDTSSQSVVQDISIRGGTDHWYVHIDAFDASYKFEIGYVTQRGRFYCLAGSNTVAADRDPVPYNGGNGKSASARFEYLKLYSPSNLVVGTCEDTDDNGRQDDFVSADFDDRSRTITASERFVFEVDAELIITGQTHPNAELTVMGESVDVHRDGSFQYRTDFANGRRVYPTVATTPDGLQQRTVVVAVERNTKELEPVMFGQE